MTRKDFQTIADIIAAMPSHSPSLRAQKPSVTNSFADGLALKYPNFKKDLFVKACQSKNLPLERSE